MRLRRRLTISLGVLLALGLLVSGVVVYTSVRSYLYGRLDDQLDAAQQQAYRYLQYQWRHDLPLKLRALSGRVSPDAYVLVLGPYDSTQVLLQRPSGSASRPDPAPVVPASLPVQRGLGVHVFGQGHGVYRPSSTTFQLSARGQRGATYQAEAVRVPQGTLVVAVPLASTVETLDSLVRVEILAGSLVVLVACGIAFFTVRRELGPLEDMTETAGAIASGELGRRVPADDEGSEVGRLGRALNGMLTQIQAAFDQKSASEHRLRQFVADASHELRTPLTSIRGYAELLRKGALPDAEARQRALSRVESEAIRMSVLVDDLLLLARLDQGRPVERVPVDVRRVAAEAVEDARAIDPDRPVDLEAPGPVVVLGDEEGLRQVVHNLVRNALIHTPAGTPVRVEVSDGGSTGRLLVADEGPGMTGEQASHVFDRFFRADPARTGEGTGLGLSIVRAVAESLGGEASVDSAPGEGSTFTVELPRFVGTGAPAAPAPAAPATAAPATAPAAGRPEPGETGEEQSPEPCDTPARQTPATGLVTAAPRQGSAASRRP